MFLNIVFQLHFLYSDVKAEPNEMWYVRFVKQVSQRKQCEKQENLLSVLFFDFGSFHNTGDSCQSLESELRFDSGELGWSCVLFENLRFKADLHVQIKSKLLLRFK